MKYYIEEIHKSGDEFRLGCTEDRNEAIGMARSEWNHLSANDKKNNKIEVRIYVEDIEDENCDCFDYSTINWRPTPTILDIPDVDFDEWRISAVWSDGTTVDNDLHRRTETVFDDINDELAESEEWFWEKDPAGFLVSFYEDREWVDEIRISR